MQQLETLYWEGVRGEIENIIRTLKIFQAPEYADGLVDDVEENDVHGYDTFLDQVNQQARAFALRYREFHSMRHNRGRKLTRM